MSQLANAPAAADFKTHLPRGAAAQAGGAARPLRPVEPGDGYDAQVAALAPDGPVDRARRPMQSPVELPAEPTSGSSEVANCATEPARDPKKGRVILAGRNENYAGADRDPAKREATRQNASEFSAQERRWIDEVFGLPEIRLIYFAYAGVPPVILHRLLQIPGRQSVSGQYRNGERRIAMDDDAARPYPQGELGVVEIERVFKQVLIHELIHFFVDQVRARPGAVVPAQMMVAFALPTREALREHEFGWFVVRGMLFNFAEFDIGGGTLALPVSMAGEVEAVVAWRKAKGYYEKPPTEHAQKDPGEDIADSMSYMLLDDASRAQMRAKCPKRAALLDRYLDHLIRLANRTA